MFNKLINNKLTDRQFKLIFFISNSLVILSLIFLLMETKNIKQKYNEYTQNQKIIIMDEQGVQYQKTIYEGVQETFDVFATAFIKKIGTLNYNKINQINNYVKTYTDVDTYQKYKNFIDKYNWIQNTDLLQGIYNISIDEIKIKKEEYFFKTKIFFESETVNRTFQFFIKISLKQLQPTAENSLGIFVTSLDIYEQEEGQKLYSIYLKKDKDK